MRVTLGPRSKAVLIQKKWGAPIVCNDGVTIAKEFELKDPEENSMSRPVATRKEKAQVATISAHKDPTIGELVADAMEKVGAEGVITVEESKTTETTLTVVEGMHARFEADDFLAASVAREERRGGTVSVATGDCDAFRLASQRTTILQPVRAGEMARIGPSEVRERYGVDPKQVPDLIALRGDPSDKLPGAKGVGPKGAATLLRKYGTLEAALKDGCFATQADQLRLYRSIATWTGPHLSPR